MVILYLIVLFLFLPATAWAYVDPGSISVILQVVIAFGLGLIIAFKRVVVNAVKSAFSMVFGKKKVPTENEEPNGNKE